MKFGNNPIPQQPEGIRNSSGGTGALTNDTSREAEITLRGNIRYINTKEGSHLPFKGLLQPLGVPEDHVNAMLQDAESYPGLYLHPVDVDPETGIIPGYEEPDVPSLEITRQRLTAKTLKKNITDLFEIARIEKGVEDGGEYPYFYRLSSLAVHMYAEFMRKYTNNPRIGVFKDNIESLQFLEALKGDKNGEKFDNAGIPMSGIFSTINAKVMYEGESAHWVSLAPYSDGFEVRWIRRNYISSYGYCMPTVDGYSPLLIEYNVPA